MANVNVPNINISAFLNPNSSEQDKLVIVNEVSQAVRTVGVFYVCGHSITEARLAEMSTAARRYFDLDKEVKESMPIKPGGFTRGYVGVGGWFAQIFFPNLENVANFKLFFYSTRRKRQSQIRMQRGIFIWIRLERARQTSKCSPRPQCIPKRITLGARMAGNPSNLLQ
jgi:hypothetical protein